jgi:hypothetical protein
LGEVDTGLVYEIQSGRAIEVNVRATAGMREGILAFTIDAQAEEQEADTPARKTQRPMP